MQELELKGFLHAKSIEDASRLCGWVSTSGGFFEVRYEGHDGWAEDKNTTEEGLLSKGWVKCTSIYKKVNAFGYKHLTAWQENTLKRLGYYIYEGNL